MSHRKMKTEPCFSPESPFMRKPSKQFLKRITFNRIKNKQSDKNMAKTSEYYPEQNLTKLAFIPTGSSSNLNLLKNQTSKLKKTTIQMGTFKIKHENIILKTQLQEMQRKNSQLTEANKDLINVNQELKKELEMYQNSRISKQSQETLEYTDADDRIKSNKLIKICSMESLQLDSYEILPTESQIFNYSSVILDEQYMQMQDFNFMSSSLSKNIKPRLQKQKQINKKDSSHQLQLSILSNRIQYLEKQLQDIILRERSLEQENKSLRLCASMTKRQLDHKDSELKQIKIKEKKKKYFEKFFQLSSEDDNQFC